MKYLTLLLTLMLAIQVAKAQIHPVADMQQFENQLKSSAGKLTSIESDFTQVKHLDMFDEDVTSSGKFSYKKENKISLIYSKPISYTIVINNGKLKIVADGKKSIMSLNSNKMMNEMQDMITACMIGDLSNMSNDYILNYQEDNQQYLIKITPKSNSVKEYVSGIEIWLSKTDMSVDQLRMYETETDYTDYKFSNKRFNQLKDESRFAID